MSFFSSKLFPTNPSTSSLNTLIDSATPTAPGTVTDSHKLFLLYVYIVYFICIITLHAQEDGIVFQLLLTNHRITEENSGRKEKGGHCFSHVNCSIFLMISN